jgi:hypothetical protein
MRVCRSAVLLLSLSVLSSLPALAQVPSVELIDAEGRTAQLVLESSRVFVRLTDPAANGNDALVEQVTAQVSSALAADAEELTLTETGPETGVFEGWIQLEPASTPPAPLLGDGDLETARDAGPPYQFDTLTATYTHAGGTVSDTVAVAGSRTSFLDAWGNPASSLAVGSTARIQVEDQNVNNPTLWDSILISLYSLTTGDAENVYLPETSRGSGVFEREVRLQESPYPNPEDDDLQVQPNEQIEARHTDVTGDTASGALATVSLLSIRFVDDQGRPTAELLESGIARVQVFSLYDNATSGVDAVAVQLSSEDAGDQELVTLTETGPTTGVFEGSIRLLYAPGNPGSGRLETANGGSPDYEADQVTASFGPFGATARTVGSRVLFLDAFGRPASSYPLGSPVYLRVIDQNANDPTWLDETNVVLRVPGSGDTQSFPLLETGYDTGVFEGTLPTASGTGIPFDARLQGWIGLAIEAEHANSNSPDPTVATAVFTGGSVLFVDSQGQPAAVYLEGSEAHVRVVAPLAGTSSVEVGISTQLAGDVETLILAHTAPGSGVYEGSISLRPLGSTTQQWNGSLETTQSAGPPHEFDTLRVVYGDASAEVELTGSRIELLDAYGAATGSYAAGSRVYIRVEDQNFNTPGNYDTLTLTVTSPDTGDVETLEFLETGRETGVFTGSVPLADSGAASPQDGFVQAPAGSRIVATHQNAMGFSSSRAEALVEDADILFIDEQGLPTAELLENGTARVRVASRGNNVTSGADAVQVELRSLYSNDQELAVLTESGPDTGVFEGSIRLLYAPGNPGSGRLDVSNSGSPEYRQETVTATFGALSATARTVGSRLLFVDVFGRETDRYALGSPVYVRVINPSANYPNQVDDGTVTLRVPGGDQETVELLETGFDTGVFEGELPTAQGFNWQGDGRLQGSVGLTIEAEHGNWNSPHATFATAAFSGSSVLFVDTQGQPATVYLEGSEAYVRVVAPLAGTSTVTVGISTALAGDVETLTLSQTAPGSGVYEGSISMEPVGSAAQQWDGSLETTQSEGPPHEFDTLRAFYGDASAEVGLTGSRIELLDAYGAVTGSYASGSRAYLRVEDQNFNTSGNYDSLEVTVTSPDTGDVETLNLLERERDSGIFEGSLPLQDSVVDFPQDGSVQVRAGSRIVATRQNAMGFSSSRVEALIEDADLLFIDEQGLPTAELLENGTARVRVFSLGDNTTSGADTVPVDLRSLYSNDQELVMLTETGPSTGVFEGSVRLLYAPGNPGSGRLDVSNSGSPEYRQETVTAAFRSQTATARTIGSRVLFVDAFGRETGRYALGSPVYLRVIEPNANYPNQIDDILVTLRNGLDQEEVPLLETGFDTGVFEGMLPTTQGYSPVGDGRLQGAVGLTIQAEHGNWNSPHATFATAVFTGGSVLFVDIEGQPATVYLEGSEAYLRVVAPLAGTTTVEAGISSQLAGDVETVTLAETAPGSGIYEGSIRLRPVVSPVEQWNGWLETSQYEGQFHAFDTLRVVYGDSSDEVGLTGSRIDFLDAYGAVTGSYASGSTVYIRVEDQNFNTPGNYDQVDVKVTVPATGDVETVTFLETGRETGVFTGSLPLDDNGSASPEDNRLQAPAGARILAEHRNAMGFSWSRAEALIEDADLFFIDEQGLPAAELLENGTARMRVISLQDSGSLQVELRSLYSGDQELVTLAETGPATGVFEGSIRLLYAPGNPGSGRLDVSGSGSPEYRQETVTATFRSRTATARTVGSRVLFVDAFGRETGRYALGSPAYLRVIDPSANYPDQINDVVVTVRVPGGEREFVELTETGFDTGVFEGTLPTAQGSGPQGDGTLQGAVGLAIEAEHGNWNSPHPSLATAVFAGSSVLFVDADGQPAAIYLEGSRAYVRVVAPLAGTATVAVDLSVALSGDLETLALVETAPGSGVYENSIRLRPLGSGIQSGNGSIETTQSEGPPHEYDTLRVFYGGSSASVGLTGSRLSFVDAYGAETDSYAAGATAYVRLEDHNRDEPGAVDLAAVILQAGGTLESEEALLTETGPDTGVFEGSLPLAANALLNPGDGILQAPAGILIEASYLNAMGFTYSRAEALITDAGIAFVDDQGRPAAELLEGGSARVRVFSAGANANPSGLDTVQVELRSLQAGDQELLTLTETGANTSVFEGMILLVFAPGNPGSGRLETANGGNPEYRQDTVTASLGTVSATARTVGSRIVFLDLRGREVSAYGARSMVRVQVADPNRNLPGQVDNSSIQLIGYDNEILPLVETGADTGLFEGSMPTSEDPTPSGDGRLWHSPEVTASYGNYNSPFPTLAKVAFRDDFVPNVTGDTADAISGQPVTVAVLANDADPEDGPLTVVVVSQGEHGTVTINADSTVTYTSVAGYTGPDTFTYVAADARDGEARATVTVNVAPANLPPAALDDLATTPEDQAVTVSPRANDLDPDDDPLDVTAVTQGANGAVVLNADDTVTYTPAANFGGTDSFTYTLTDGAATDAATVTVTVTPVDDPPVANDDAATTSEDAAVTVAVKANDTDVDSPLDVTAVTQGTNGAVALNADDTVTYTPAADFHGSDSFTYTLTDGSGSDTATVAVTVTPVNDAPTANADAASTSEETAVTVAVLANDGDVDLDTLTVTGVTQGANGAVTANPVTYTPALNFHGTDSFTYTVSDGQGGTATATVSVTVTPVNDAPVAVADAAATPWNTAVTVSVLANDVDVDGPSLAVSGVTQGTNGTVTVDAGQTVTYTPVARFAGTDSFSYTVTDGAGGSATATVTVTVQKPGRVGANLQVLYGFNEGSGSTVADVSGVGTPLNLTVGAPANVSWLTGGLSIDAPTLIQSSTTATKVINAVEASGAVTVEAWIVPANTTQTGPARIVTISQNATRRDVTLGQLGNRFETRLRTSTTSNDGLPAQTTPVGSVTAGLMHVVYTRTSAGAATTYIDGVAVAASTVGGSLSNWANYRLGIGNEISSGHPWLGDLYLVAVYSRALPAAEVVQNYAAGPD